MATPALALEASKSGQGDATPDAAWAAIGEFCEITLWHPAVEKCVLSKKDGKPLRTLSLKGGGTIVEELMARHVQDQLQLRHFRSPLPVDDYRSTLTCRRAAANGDRLERQVRRQGRAGRRRRRGDRGIYHAGLASLARS